jgi:hypothetical protein
VSSLEPRPGHVVELEELPTCNLCRVESATWDARTKYGSSWAYLCEACNELHAAEPGVTGVGTGQRLVARPKPHHAPSTSATSERRGA